MDKKSAALSKFRKPYTCAQTIWAAFADERGDNLASMKINSGGRAPENMCGALYAALQILPPEKRESAAAEFARRAGSTKCLEIKTKYKTPCSDCVKIAAELFET